MIKKAITHLKLNAANKGKKQKLDLVAAEYMRTTQAYVDFQLLNEIKEPDKYAPVPEQEVPTQLSKRWQRCAWQQACGIVQSWYSNGCKNPPILRNIGKHITNEQINNACRMFKKVGFPFLVEGVVERIARWDSQFLKLDK